jgi:glutamyl-tRNA synthetase
MTTRVRFAPSPTGYLHIGGARTALFNYLFARNTAGKFILRIEDTDKERSTKESELEILEALKWMGLDWDEGPGKSADDSMYYQTKRLAVYHKYADKLLSEGKAYKCYCTKEDLDAERKKAEAEKRAFKYDSRCSRLAPEQIKKNDVENKPYTVRLKVEQAGETIINDIVRGEVKVQNATLDDMIILRADKNPIYNFVVVVDDVEMGITHVIRGEDHLSNTPRQLHLYKALGFAIPQFAHIPLILGQDKSKLSKRHGEVSVLRYRELGYLPDALFNYLSFLGWAPEDNEDYLSREQIIQKFTLERVHKSGAMFDNMKLMHFNGLYIRKMNLDELTERCLPYLKANGMVNDSTDNAFIKKVVGLQQEKLRILSEISDLSVYFFKDDYPFVDEAKKVWEKNAADRVKVVEMFKKIIEEIGVDKVKVEERLKAEMETAGIKPKVYMHVIRVAISGCTMGPGLYDISEALGREKTLVRLNKML